MGLGRRFDPGDEPVAVSLAASCLGAFAVRRRWPINLRVALLGLFLAHSLFSLVFAVDFSYAWPYWIDFLKTMTIAYLIGR